MNRSSTRPGSRIGEQALPSSPMTYLQPWQSYRQVTAKTASPGQLVVMLYEGAIGFLMRALSGFEFEDPAQFNSTISNNLLRAQDVLNELNASLDMERGGEIAVTLRRLYDYMDRRLTESNLQKTPAGIEDTVQRLCQLRDAWREMLSETARFRAVEQSASLSACV